MTLQKLSPDDINLWDWNWFNKFGEEVTAELASAYLSAIISEFPDIEPVQAQRLATEYASERAALLLKVDGDLNLMQLTRQRTRLIISEGIRNGDSLGQVAKRLRQDFAFSRERAENIARTETATALGQGTKGAAISQGRDQKHWVTQGASDPRVDEICLNNEAQGWIGINKRFQSGHDTIPAHPQCMCVVRYRTFELVDNNGVIAQARCPVHGYLLGENVVAARLYCRNCKLKYYFDLDNPAGLALQ